MLIYEKTNRQTIIAIHQKWAMWPNSVVFFVCIFHNWVSFHVSHVGITFLGLGHIRCACFRFPILLQSTPYNMFSSAPTKVTSAVVAAGLLKKVCEASMLNSMKAVRMRPTASTWSRNEGLAPNPNSGYFPGKQHQNHHSNVQSLEILTESKFDDGDMEDA